jgi:PAS domain S-box-containing protein/putative nucleotidyltransferase with HDIG domain
MESRLGAGETVAFETLHRRKDGSLFPVEVRARPFWQDERRFSVSLARDISERKQAERALQESEERLRQITSSLREVIWLRDAQTRQVLYVNPAFEELTGRTCESFYKNRDIVIDIIHPDDKDDVIEALEQRFEGVPYDKEHRIVHLDGSLRWVSSQIFPVRNDTGDVYRWASIMEDITERKQAEVQLLASEQLFRALVENSPDFIARYDLEYRRIYVNPAIQKLFASSVENVLGETPVNQSPIYAPQVYIEHLQLVIKTAAESILETPFRTAQGEMHWGHIRFIPEFGPEGKVASVLAIGRDIHEIKENEQRFRMLAENFPDFVIRFDCNARCTYVNPTVENTLGMPAGAIIGKTLQELPYFNTPEQNDALLALILRTFNEGIPNATETHWNTETGERTFDIRYIPEKDATGNVISVLSIIREITERRQHEREREVIITVSTALRQAVTRTEILNIILDQLIDLFDADGAVLVLPDPHTGGLVDEMGRGVIGERMVGLNIPPGKGICNWVITNKKPYLSNRVDQDTLFYRPDLLGKSHCLISIPLIAQEQVTGALWIARQLDFVEQDLRLLTAIADIAANAIHRITLHEQTEQQLHRLIALHQIDLAISTNIDLNITLNVILDSVKDELEVDAVSILLINPITHTLDYTAGIGFRTRNIEQSHVRLGSGCAGRAAQELRTISGLDIGEGSGIFVRSSLLASEEFMSHYATPLVVKGLIKGVLEVFHRKPLEPEHTWFSYFETLATQSAIAIENASLFENLQRSNMELTLAYDATIEGWSRALDLRDRETEGHTQRVAEMALELADKMGVNDVEKLDLWRGALLHDIGKMGVPDAILLKPGPLSNEEWEIMRQHPLYAYEMLSPIKYLKHALEIPYCHHEKWDGSGYPRGLKGNEIPLSARVFAVIDVFDALISDRPYSKPWPREKAYQYIRDQADKHFDPQVVKIFLETQ